MNTVIYNRQLTVRTWQIEFGRFVSAQSMGDFQQGRPEESCCFT